MELRLESSWIVMFLQRSSCTFWNVRHIDASVLRDAVFGVTCAFLRISSSRTCQMMSHPVAHAAELIDCLDIVLHPVNSISSPPPLWTTFIVFLTHTFSFSPSFWTSVEPLSLEINNPSLSPFNMFFSQNRCLNYFHHNVEEIKNDTDSRHSETFIVIFIREECLSALNSNVSCNDL